MPVKKDWELDREVRVEWMKDKLPVNWDELPDDGKLIFAVRVGDYKKYYERKRKGIGLRKNEGRYGKVSVGQGEIELDIRKGNRRIEEEIEKDSLRGVWGYVTEMDGECNIRMEHKIHSSQKFFNYVMELVKGNMCVIIVKRNWE